MKTAIVSLHQLAPSNYWTAGLPGVRERDLDLAQASGLEAVEWMQVRPLPMPANATPYTQQSYEVLKGIRTWQLAARLKIHDGLPVIVRSVSDAEAKALVLGDYAKDTEDPVSQAERLRDLCRGSQGLSITAAGETLGLSRTMAHHRLRLLKLTQRVRNLVRTGQLDWSLAVLLVSLDAEMQNKGADRVVLDQYTRARLLVWIKGAREGRDDHIAVAPKRTGQAGRSQSVVSLEGKPAWAPQVERAITDKFGSVVTVRQRPDGQGVVSFNYHSEEALSGLLHAWKVEIR